MDSLFNHTDNDRILDRINQLSGQTRPQWGKMTVSQMLAHCQAPLLVAFGEHKLKRGLMGVLFGRIAKKQLLGPTTFKRNLPTDPSFIVRDEKNFDSEKDKLVGLVQRFARNGEDGLTRNPHPFFGKLTAHEWDVLQWKHLDHHLKQFGV